MTLQIKYIVQMLVKHLQIILNSMVICTMVTICCLPLLQSSFTPKEICRPWPLILWPMQSEWVNSTPSSWPENPDQLKSINTVPSQGSAHNPNQSGLMELWLDFPGQRPSLVFTFRGMRSEEWLP